MTTGFLTATCLCLAIGQSASDIYYTNQRNHSVPVDVQESARANFREFILYSSTDQGQRWQQVSVIPATKNAFAFYAPADGSYWLQVATVTRQGVQDPDEKAILKGPPQLKMLIDTLKPIVKSFQAQRNGDDIVVAWDIQEDHPDLSRDGVKLEYHVKDSLIEAWKPVSIAVGLKGQTSFNPGSKQAVSVRIWIRDLAGNQSYGIAEVAGTLAATGFTPPLQGGGLIDKDGLKPLPEGITIPKRPIEEPKQIDEKKVIVPPPPPEHKALFSPPGSAVIMPPPPKKEIAQDIVADSRLSPQVDPVKTPGGLEGIQSLAHAAPARKPLPLLQYINQHLVRLQYEIKRHGPSGIGGVQIWLTKDDGETWVPYAEIKDLANELPQGRQERDFEFRDKFDAPFPDGIYGLTLVVKNRAGMGREPRPGDAPEMRIEIDTKAPVAQLFKPTIDPQNPTQLLLKWSAQDKNLGETPITLEYSDKREGPWHPIETNLKNVGRFTNQLVTGDFSWKIPVGTPVQVYLRLRVRDKAGNESIAVTAEPQFVDLIEPEGALIGIVPLSRRP
ncbi:MAG: hypothetical protein FJ303_02880 [Planctomycetes bacterium]|nr:hypothetical protein [Planctomycetota bacterium]